MKVVIVESPAKAKTINRYLGSDYQVLASFGHVRDLPSKDGSVKPDEDFDMVWEVDSASKKRLNDIAAAVRNADEVILATDPDREGEAISWHVLDVLKSKKVLKDKPVRRVVFNAITKSAVSEAMANPRDIDEPLVDAYLARRALDYLVGFSLSPILWRKLPGSRSAGRVQSVALRLVAEREDEIERFRPQEYWSVTAALEQAGTPFEARLYAVDGNKVDRLDIGTETEAAGIRDAVDAGRLTVSAVEKKPQKRNPYAPFTTSTLQQDASSRLGFSPSRTMQIAQRLYEGAQVDGESVGLITYMRTDAVQMAPEAIEATRREIASRFGDSYLPEKPRMYQTRAANAQEAHEAIRPTELSRHPDAVRHLEPEQHKLYELIWKRTMASQVRSAEIERTSVDLALLDAGRDIVLRATGSVTTFDGFLRLYATKTSDDDDESRELPAIAEGDAPALTGCTIEQHFTQPPPRYTEASLIRRMEELGIGRPSTYASTLAVLQDRDYVRLDKRALVPEDRGRLVTAFLQSFFTRYVEYDFTANLERQLDEISAGRIEWKDVLRQFWREFSVHVDEIKDLRVSEVLDALNDLLGEHIFPAREDGGDPRQCPSCGDGRLSLKVGKFGAFIGCSNYPECSYTRQLGDAATGRANDDTGPKAIGTHPDLGEEITVRTGRFGPYVQMGEGKDAKRASIPKGWDPDSIDLEKALRLVSLPREVGLHPESGKPITAGIGRYGPFVQSDGKYANLPDADEVFTVGLNRAVDLLAARAAAGGRRNATAVIKTLGDHPDGGPVTVRDGRYGPYVNHGKINATLPNDTSPESVTMEQALELIAAKAAAGGGGRRRARARG